jgi:precorrin-3B synthase
VRNIVASPLSGRVGGTTDIRGLVTELDDAIQSEPALAELPGRFLFGVDDGRGDISGLGADVGAHFLDDDTAALLLAGQDPAYGWRGPPSCPHSSQSRHGSSQPAERLGG